MRKEGKVLCFENKLYKTIVNGNDFEVHASRIIASWINATGRPIDFHFKDWLETIGIFGQDREDLYRFAINGKLELESSAKNYMDIYKDIKE